MNRRFFAALIVTSLASITWAQTHPVILNFSEMDEYMGMKLDARFINVSSNTVEDRIILDSITQSAFSLTFTGSHVSGFNIDFHIDRNRNGYYDSPPSDAAWRRSTGPLHSTVSINFINDINYTDVKFNSTAAAEYSYRKHNHLYIAGRNLVFPQGMNNQPILIQGISINGRLIWSVEHNSAKGDFRLPESSQAAIIRIRNGNTGAQSILSIIPAK